MKTYIEHPDMLQDTAAGRWIPKTLENSDFVRAVKEMQTGEAELAPTLPAPQPFYLTAAIQKLRDYDKDTATAQDVRDTLAALIRVVANEHKQEG